VLTFQQYTGAVMAKSVEDTAFYVYNRFVALNEVGGDPGAFGGTVEGFHAANLRRLETTPHSLLATSTHDTKFGEDARARLYVLSELAGDWADWVTEWRELNRRHKTHLDGRTAPDANEEYRIYQTLLACWPAEPFESDEAFRQRIAEHVRKAVNEAKVNTHWQHPNEAWLQACDRFVHALLTPALSDDFLASFDPKARRVAHLGLVNTLAQVALKIGSPGVPDFYQGAELWNLTLVDPDNRGLIDWPPCFAGGVPPRPWRELLRRWKDGGIKLRLTQELLRFRRERLALFQRGSYEPLGAEGRFADRVLAFHRQHAGESVVVVVPRLTATLGTPPLGLVWEDTVLALPPARDGWRDVLTGRRWKPETESLAVAELFCELPVAVLHAGG
jgi:(1->4)-alpha-D-glucan 1-alpha-D-glucosylmutase